MGLLKARGDDGSAGDFKRELGIEQLLVIEPGFGEEDGPFMEFLFPFVGGFAAGFGSFGTLLRFKPNF